MRWNGHLTLQKTHARGRIVVVAVVRQETHRLKEPIFRNLWLLNKSSSTVFQVTRGVSKKFFQFTGLKSRGTRNILILIIVTSLGLINC